MVAGSQECPEGVFNACFEHLKHFGEKGHERLDTTSGSPQTKAIHWYSDIARAIRNFFTWNSQNKDTGAKHIGYTLDFLRVNKKWAVIQLQDTETLVQKLLAKRIQQKAVRSDIAAKATALLKDLRESQSAEQKRQAEQRAAHIDQEGNAQATRISAAADEAIQKLNQDADQSHQAYQRETDTKVQEIRQKGLQASEKATQEAVAEKKRLEAQLEEQRLNQIRELNADLARKRQGEAQKLVLKSASKLAHSKAFGEVNVILGNRV